MNVNRQPKKDRMLRDHLAHSNCATQSWLQNSQMLPQKSPSRSTPNLPSITYAKQEIDNDDSEKALPISN